MKDKDALIRKITGTGLLLSLSLILQIIGNLVSFGPVSINLCLIPVVLGAIIYGPWVGALLGFCNGIFVLFAPSTISVFWPISAWGTILVCLLKCTLAGLVAGFVYLPFKKNHQLVGSILASILVPVINTGLFALACMTFFRPLLEQYGSSGYATAYSFLFLGIIGWNFIFELGSSIILSPTVFKISGIIKKKYNKN